MLLSAQPLNFNTLRIWEICLSDTPLAFNQQTLMIPVWFNPFNYKLTAKVCLHSGNIWTTIKLIRFSLECSGRGWIEVQRKFFGVIQIVCCSFIQMTVIKPLRIVSVRTLYLFTSNWDINFKIELINSWRSSKRITFYIYYEQFGFFLFLRMINHASLCNKAFTFLSPP